MGSPSPEKKIFSFWVLFCNHTRTVCGVTTSAINYDDDVGYLIVLVYRQVYYTSIQINIIQCTVILCNADLLI